MTFAIIHAMGAEFRNITHNIAEGVRRIGSFRTRRTDSVDNADPFASLRDRSLMDQAELLGTAMFIRGTQEGRVFDDMGLPFTLVYDQGRPDICVRVPQVNGELSERLLVDRSLVESRLIGTYDVGKQEYLRVKVICDTGVGATAVSIPSNNRRNEDPAWNYGNVKVVLGSSLLLIDE